MQQASELQEDKQVEIVDQEAVTDIMDNSSEDLDARVDMLIESGMTVSDACKAVGVSRSSFSTRRKKREQAAMPKMLNINYASNTEDNRVVIMIGNPKEIEHLLKLAQGR